MKYIKKFLELPDVVQTLSLLMVAFVICGFAGMYSNSVGISKFAFSLAYLSFAFIFQFYAYSKGEPREE